MKILFITICLDGMPFLPLIYAELRKLPKEIDWEWNVMEGTAVPVHCTRWVNWLEPRLSNDGTTQFLESVSRFDNRVKYLPSKRWKGKIAMVNAPLTGGPCAPVAGKMVFEKGEEFLLWQMDGDEVWDADQILCVHEMFRLYREKNAAFFWCRYFVGPDKVITTRNCFGNNPSFEWLRVWRIKPGMLFKTHEPPVVEGLKLNPFSHAETEARGLVFSHYAYATRAQVAFKEQFYAGPNNPNAKHYRGLTDRWEKFQQEKTWPRPLRELMPWCEPFVTVNKV